jgi:FkbM family methyltransferase
VRRALRRSSRHRLVPSGRNDVFSACCRGLFWFLVIVGRPSSGIRPRRWTYWLGRRGFSGIDPGRLGFKWYRDRRGCWLCLHPYFLIDREIIAFGDYDRPLHDVIDQLVRPGMVCFDVGANLGAVSVHLAHRVAPHGTVFAFEPVPEVARRLRAHVRANRFASVIHVQCLALADRMGSARMAVACLQAANQGTATLVGSDQIGVGQTRVVEVQPVDYFIAKNGIQKIDIMKIDIQGAEPLLLAGGPRTFGELGPDLLMEVAPEDLRGLGKTSRDLLTAVEAYGYSVFKVEAHGIGNRLAAREVGDDFAASNVYCTKQGRRP